MKRIVILLVIALSATASLLAQAQKDVTQFLGVPVDGSKSEMIQKLKEKGYVISSNNKDVLTGEFNGVNVNLHIVTNNNKVCRIMVSDVNTMSEGDIKIRFNKLCKQFQNNKRYLSGDSSTFILPDDEDIGYNMRVKNKRYEALFYQCPAVDSILIAKAVDSIFLSIYSEEQVSKLTKGELSIKESFFKLFLTKYILQLSEEWSKKPVWFMITKHYEKYYITMFYDNEYNRANGEDL